MLVGLCSRLRRNQRNEHSGKVKALLLLSFAYKDCLQPEFTEYSHDVLCNSAPVSNNKLGYCLRGQSLSVMELCISVLNENSVLVHGSCHGWWDGSCKAVSLEVNFVNYSFDI